MSEFDATEIAYKNGLAAGQPKWNAVDSADDYPDVTGEYMCVLLVPTGHGDFKKVQAMVLFDVDTGWKLSRFSKKIVISWMNPIDYPKIALN